MGLTRLQRIAYTLRKFHLLQMADLFWFCRLYWLSRNANNQFMKKHPGVPVPPAMVLYDILGNCDLSGYYYSGLEQARDISAIITAERPGQPLNILEWGCGPARVLPHMSASDGAAWELWGSDYNPRSISWCRQHWPENHFLLNGLEPPIPAGNELFDVIYCVSVFTHLSEVRHYQWIEEILRLLKAGGLFIGTFHGDAFRDHLTQEEQRRFDRGNLVIRDKIREGKKDFTAYHSDNFVRSLLTPFDTVKKRDSLDGLHQTVWTGCKKV